MRVRRLTATLALSALALAGCSGEGEGEETTSSPVEPTVIDPSGDSSSTSGSSSSSTSGSSTSSTSEADADGPPEEAKANTKEGAEAFAKWYWEESGELHVTGDASTLREATSSDCEVCLESIRLKEEAASKYGAAKKNPYAVQVVRSAKDEQGVWRVKVKVDQPEFEYFKNGKPSATMRASNFEVNPELERTSDGWRVVDWLLVQ